MATILYVDDILEGRGLAKAYQDLVAKVGHSLLTASGGKEALEIITQEKVDLLYLDWNMPGIGGRGVLEELKLRGASLPVVFCSARSEEELMGEARRIGYAHIRGKVSSLDEKGIDKFLEGKL